MTLQESGEMYLETIHVLSKKKANVRAVDIGEELGYSRPSVSRAIAYIPGTVSKIKVFTGPVILHVLLRRTVKYLQKRGPLGITYTLRPKAMGIYLMLTTFVYPFSYHKIPPFKTKRVTKSQTWRLYPLPPMPGNPLLFCLSEEIHYSFSQQKLQDHQHCSNTV